MYSGGLLGAKGAKSGARPWFMGPWYLGVGPGPVHSLGAPLSGSHGALANIMCRFAWPQEAEIGRSSTSSQAAVHLKSWPGQSRSQT